jgi:hypothetical protein
VKEASMVRAKAALLLLVLAAAAPIRAGAAPKPPWKAGDVVVVKREGVRLMPAARFYGKACAERVAPGERVRIAQRQRGWARLAAPGAGRCWLHESAWSDRTPGEATAAAPAGSQRDVELAARGFSEEEGRRFRGEHGELDAAFAAVEDHLARGGEPAAEELTRFADEGAVGGER